MIEPGLRRLTVSVPDEQIADLRERLARTRWPDQLDGISWEYGASLPYIKELAQYWLEKYDWKKAEAGLNSFANYEMLCNGIETHFIHERSIDPHAIPLLMVHGWPGSFFEFHKIIRMLTMPGTNGTRAQAFHVVVPSLPGYGFSSAPTQPGFGINEMAKTFDQLMVSLGYTTYVAQGGDWGSAVVTALGGAHSNHCRAIYMNGCFAGPEFTNPLHVAQLLNAKLPLANWFPVFISFQEMAGLRATQAFIDKETGYSKLQATKPQTIGFALNDSPVGLLAYIVEKFRTWSDCHGDVESRFTKDELLTNVSIYWYNAAITSSMRLYYETMGPFAKPNNRFDGYVRVPVAVGNFPKELYQVPRAWAASKYNLKQWSIFNSGGHFAALEEPDALVEDMRKFFAKYH